MVFSSRPGVWNWRWLLCFTFLLWESVARPDRPAAWCFVLKFTRRLEFCQCASPQFDLGLGSLQCFTFSCRQSCCRRLFGFEFRLKSEVFILGNRVSDWESWTPWGSVSPCVQLEVAFMYLHKTSKTMSAICQGWQVYGDWNFLAVEELAIRWVEF